MANSDSLSQQTAYNIGAYSWGLAQGVSVGAASNSAGIIPILSGGLTNGGAVANSGGVIVTRVTFCNPSGNIATANVGIFTSSDGNTSNAVVSTFALTNINGTGKYQVANIAAPFVSNVISGAVTQALYVAVSSVGATTGTIDVKVSGEIVSF